MPHALERSDNRILHPMTTTTFGIEGYRVVQSLGVAIGITVRSRSVLGFIGASWQTVFGGRISMFVELCEKARQEAFELMLQHAEQSGANAVVGIRYDANEIMKGVTEIVCYGTAVVVEADG